MFSINFVLNLFLIWMSRLISRTNDPIGQSVGRPSELIAIFDAGRVAANEGVAYPRVIQHSLGGDKAGRQQATERTTRFIKRSHRASIYVCTCTYIHVQRLYRGEGRQGDKRVDISQWFRDGQGLERRVGRDRWWNDDISRDKWRRQDRLVKRPASIINPCMIG